MSVPQDGEPRFLSSENFHPEFGYLCPTPSMRDRMHRTARAVLVGIMIGAACTLALTHRGGDSRTDLVADSKDHGGLMPSADAAMPPPNGTADAAAAPLPASPDSARVARAEPLCDDLPGSFLLPRCSAGKVHKARSGRAIARPAVSPPLGRTATTIIADEPSTPAPTMHPSIPGRMRASAAATVALADPPPAAPTAPPRAKSAPRHKAKAPSPALDQGLNAYAAAPWLYDAQGRSGYAHPVSRSAFGYGDWGNSW